MLLSKTLFSAAAIVAVITAAPVALAQSSSTIGSGASTTNGSANAALGTGGSSSGAAGTGSSLGVGAASANNGQASAALGTGASSSRYGANGGTSSTLGVGGATAGNGSTNTALGTGASSSGAGADLSSVRPGSAEAARLKERLVAEGAWSQYLEVGLGPDAEIFTKAPVLSAVGTAADAGIRAGSIWNNPEPEIALVVTSTGRIVGATLGNDVNLRDIEGRSALLLSHAKDNNASAALGPFLRLFDDGFGLDDVRRTDVTLTVRGEDGFVLEDVSSMKHISRDPEDLVAQLIGPHHQYPDGAVLYLGSMFAPVLDRDAPGQGFTHHVDDVVTVAAPLLGSLVNRIRTSDQCPPWTVGTGALFRNLAQRGLLT